MRREITHTHANSQVTELDEEISALRGALRNAGGSPDGEVSSESLEARARQAARAILAATKTRPRSKDK